MRALVGPRREHHRARVDGAGRGLEGEARRAIQGGQGAHLHAAPERRPEALGIAFEVGDDAVPRHVPVRLRSLVATAGQHEGPVGQHEAEAVPAPAPGLADLTALQHQVGYALLRQLMAYGEARLAGSDDDHIRFLGHSTRDSKLQRLLDGRILGSRCTPPSRTLTLVGCTCGYGRWP